MKKKRPYIKAYEKELIRQVREGDGDALVEIIEQHRKRINAVASGIAPHDSSLRKDLAQEGSYYLIDIVRRTFNLEYDNWLWTYAKKPLQHAMWRYKKKWSNREQEYISVPDKEQDRIAVLPYDAQAADEYWQQYNGFDSHAFVELQRKVYDCLDNKRKSDKWLVLVILKRGLDKSWQIITRDIKNKNAALSNPREPGETYWGWIHDVCGLREDLPRTWGGVCTIFAKGKPKVTIVSLRKWYSDIHIKELAECYGRKLF